MMRILMTLALIIASAGLAAGQKGTAEADYYPFNYHGEAWTGDVTASGIFGGILLARRLLIHHWPGHLAINAYGDSLYHRLARLYASSGRAVDQP